MGGGRAALRRTWLAGAVLGLAALCGGCVVATETEADENAQRGQNENAQQGRSELIGEVAAPAPAPSTPNPSGGGVEPEPEPWRCLPGNPDDGMGPEPEPWHGPGTPGHSGDHK